MQTTSTLLTCGALLMLCSSLVIEEAKAADDKASVSPVANDPSPKVAPDTKAAVKTMKTNCWTSVQDCAGFATIGGFNYDVGCSIWWNNGANGRSNMTFRAGDKQEVYVRYNDACIAIQYAPPQDQPRFYIYVHN